MSHTPHELAEEFPESVERLHALKASSTHFTKLCDEYHDVNRQIHRMETSVEPAGEAVEAVMRHKRMMLKDEIFAGLKADLSKTEPANGKSDDCPPGDCRAGGVWHPAGRDGQHHDLDSPPIGQVVRREIARRFAGR